MVYFSNLQRDDALRDVFGIYVIEELYAPGGVEEMFRMCHRKRTAASGWESQFFEGNVDEVFVRGLSEVCLLRPPLPPLQLHDEAIQFRAVEIASERATRATDRTISCPMCRVESCLQQTNELRRVKGISGRCLICLNDDTPPAVYFPGCGHVPCCEPCYAGLVDARAEEEDAGPPVLRRGRYFNPFSPEIYARAFQMFNDLEEEEVEEVH